jgi:hypothetical protein
VVEVNAEGVYVLLVAGLITPEPLYHWYVNVPVPPVGAVVNVICEGTVL